ncbi:MAG: TIGR02646 family protein [Peptostreptococcaceae bacterium]|nr:TIGR02646 family protein [Peptostreptococcaceae bacterium]
MLKVNKQSEPDFFTKFKNKEKPKSWSDYNKHRIKQELREFMINNEQDGYCPYCEQLITSSNEKSHIEHIKPKGGKYASLFQNYENLITCCSTNGICGNAKKDYYDDKFINVVNENPEDLLTYDISTGKIVPIYEEGIEYKRAIYTIELLNLNDIRLVDLRKKFIWELNYLEEEDLIYFIENKDINFIGLVNFFKKEFFE